MPFRRALRYLGGSTSTGRASQLRRRIARQRCACSYLRVSAAVSARIGCGTTEDLNSSLAAAAKGRADAVDTAELKYIIGTQVGALCESAQ